MSFRKLRIAWSVVWGVACLIMVALWIRSTHRIDCLMAGAFFLHLQFESSLGTGWLVVCTRELPCGPWRLSTEYVQDWLSVSAIEPEDVSMWGKFSHKFEAYDGSLFGSLGVPFWLIVLLTASAAAAPWLRWRFTLRTLLMATTLVAVVLGLIVAVV